MRNFITIVENRAPASNLQNEIEKILRDHIDQDAGYSGVNENIIESAAYSLSQPFTKTREDVEVVINGMDTYDPWEGLELTTIENAVNAVCEKLGIV